MCVYHASAVGLASAGPRAWEYHGGYLSGGYLPIHEGPSSRLVSTCDWRHFSPQAPDQALSNSTMSQVQSTSASTTSFETIFAEALKEYKKQTKRDISSHPLAAQLQSCDTPSAILAVLQARVQKFGQSQSDDEKWIKWVDPTVNVLFAFSATLGSGVGLVTARS